MKTSHGLNLVLVIALIIGYFYFDSRISTLKKEHAEYVSSITEAANKELLKQRENSKLALERVSQLDKELHDEKEQAKVTIDKLKRDIRSGAHKLYVKADCPNSRVPETSTTASGNHEETRAELDKEVAENLIEITEYGDEAIRQLTSCQKYIKETINARKRP